MTVQKVHIVHTSPTPENPGACMWTMWTICFCMVHTVHMCPACARLVMHAGLVPGDVMARYRWTCPHGPRPAGM